MIFKSGALILWDNSNSCICCLWVSNRSCLLVSICICFAIFCLAGQLYFHLPGLFVAADRFAAAPFLPHRLPPYPPDTVFRVSRITFFLVNRVENQNEPKRPQSGGRLGSFWFSTRPTAMGGTDYNGLGLWDKLRSCSSNCPIIQVHYNQCQCLPKAELKTKTNPNGHHSVAVWVRFGFQLDSLEKK